MEGLLLMRQPEELRPLILENGVQLHASGSCLVKLGRTHVLCAANLEAKVPGWMKGRGTGWLMLGGYAAYVYALYTLYGVFG